MPKSWSRGLTAATDARVARMATAHRGLQYVRRTPWELRRGRLSQRRMAPLTWSAPMAYAVGLIATDGCLFNTGRHVGFGTEDLQLMNTFIDCLGLARKFRTELTRTGTTYYRLQLGDVELYRWLLAIGLTPRKSLTLGAIDVPDEFLADLARGLMDGDGGILNRMLRADTHGRPGYRWEYLQTRFLSASFAHIAWLQSRLTPVLGVTGYINRYGAPSGSLMTELRFGKKESLRLLPQLYRIVGSPRLERKWRIWRAYQERHCLIE